MPHFFIEKENINQDFIKVSDICLLRHLSLALRLKKGEKVKFIDSDEFVYNCEVISVDKKNLEAKILKKEKSKRKLAQDIFLAQSILKGDAQFLAISNAVQTGVRGIYPVISDNCAVKNIKNTLKFQKIADEAFKQCERADKTTIYDVQNLKDVISKFQNIIIFAEKYANISLKNALKKFEKNEKILVVIGPEGGFSEKEFEFFKENNYNLVSLGNLIYKAPNAITAGISNIIYELNS